MEAKHGHYEKKYKCMLNPWERKILRKIYGTVQERDVWRIRTNQELIDIIVIRIYSSRRYWKKEIRMGRACVVDGTKEDYIRRKILKGRPEGRRKVGR